MPCENEWCNPECGNDCQECFNKRPINLALEVRKTPDFLALQSKYAEAQKIADAAYLEICKTFQYPDIFWVAYYGGDIFPQHHLPETEDE